MSMPSTVDPPTPDPASPRGGLDPLAMVLAWVVILLAAGLLMVRPDLGGDEDSAPEALAVPEGRLIANQDELAGRLTLGLDHLSPGLGGVDQAALLATGSTAQQVAHAILVAAIDGPEPALAELDAIVPDPVSELLVPPAVEAIQAAEGGPAASTAAVDQLTTRLGWFGELAEALPDAKALDRLGSDSVGTLLWMGGGLGVFVLAGFGGMVGLVTVVVLFATGRLPFRIPAPSRHGVYAETFAIWMLGFLLLQLVAGLVAPEGNGLLASALAFLTSLIALGWPVLRGTPWSQVRADIGLAQPRLSDLPAGVAVWAMAVPFLVIGVVLTLVLTFIVTLLTGETPQPSHPVQQAAVGAGVWEIVQLFLVASVAAPIVEETMFRGVLMTHLRGVSRRWNDWLSFAMAATVSSLLFAAIHPQGLVFIPPLAGLAMGFCVGRAWRGGLVPAMVAHGVSNGIVMAMNVLVLAS